MIGQLIDALRMPRRFVRGQGGRLALTVIALACGVALVCAIDLVNRAVLQAFTEVIDTMAGRAALQVSAGESGLFPEDVAATVAAVPGVQLAVPVVSATAFTADDTGELLTVHGVEITNEAAVRVYEARDAGGLEIADPLVFLNQPDSIVLTRTFAERRHLRAGDAITLETPTGRKPFTIRGLLEPQGVARVYGGNLVVMDLYAAEAAFTRPGFINRVDVVVPRDIPLDRVRAALTAALPAGLRVDTPAQRKADLNAVMQSLQVMLQGLGLVALVAAFLIAFNRLSTVFDARAWQLGVLRAIGVPTRSVWKELVKESLLLGTLGVALGIPLGVGLGRAILPIIATTTALNFKLAAPDAELAVQPWSLVLATLLGLAAALLAAALPARRAARATVLETIRGRGLEQPGTSGRSVAVTRVFVAAGIVISIGLQALTHTAAWGLVATAMIAVGTALAARPFLRLMHGTVEAILTRVSGPSGRFTSAIIAQSPRRTSLTIGVLGVGLGAVFWLGTVARSFEESLLDTMPHVLRGDLDVSSARIAAGVVEAPIDESLLPALRAVPHVISVAAERAIDWQYGGGPIAISAFDPVYFTAPEFGEWQFVGDHLPDVRAAVARGDAVLVSTNFVLNLGVRVGDRIALSTPSGPLALTVAGATTDFLSPRGTIEMSRETFKQYWHDTQVTHFLVLGERASDLGVIREAITARLGAAHNLKVLTVAELVTHLGGQVRRAFAPVQVLAGVVLLVVLVGVADTLAASVADRTRDFGTLRAVGVRRRHLYRVVIAEGLVIGVCGVALAAGAGLAMGTLWVQATFTYLLGWVLALHIPVGEIASTVALTLVVCVAAALPLARRAGHLEPAIALRYE